jgi:hypothetical protein
LGAQRRGTYGGTFQRRTLLTSLRRALDDLRRAGCGRVYIDGSFVTTKRRPGDFDACWELRGVDFPRLQALVPELLDFSYARAAQKARYGGELFPAEWPADLAGTTYLDFFQRDKQSGRSKGIVLLRLGDQP